jgi:hypothetical protein
MVFGKLRKSRSGRRLAIRLLAGSLAHVGGCAAVPRADDAEPRRMTAAERADFQAAWGDGADATPRRAAHAAETAAARGPAPLVYIAQQPATVWVTDDAGRQWGPVRVASGSAVRVAGPTGVAIGAAKLAEGPLAVEGRTFTIHVGAPADSAWQNRSVEGPKPTFTPREAEPRP